MRPRLYFLPKSLVNQVLLSSYPNQVLLLFGSFFSNEFAERLLRIYTPLARNSWELPRSASLRPPMCLVTLKVILFGGFSSLSQTQHMKRNAGPNGPPRDRSPIGSLPTMRSWQRLNTAATRDTSAVHVTRPLPVRKAELSRKHMPSCGVQFQHRGVDNEIFLRQQPRVVDFYHVVHANCESHVCTSFPVIFRHTCIRKQNQYYVESRLIPYLIIVRNKR